MHIIVDRNEFKKMLKIAGEICKSSNVLLTETILIKANKEQNEITCLFFNFSVKVQYKINNSEKINIIKEGTILTNLRFLEIIFTKLNDGNVELELVDTVVLKISKDDFVSNINILDPSLFIEYKLDDYSKDNKIILHTDHFKEAKNKLFQCSLSRESGKNTTINEAILTSICFNSDNNDNKLNIYATDSFRVALLTKENFQQKINITLDQDFINFIINNFEGEINLFDSNNHITFMADNIIVSYKKNELMFPNVLNVMTDDNIVATAKINARSLFNAIDRGYFVVSEEKIPSIDWIIQDNNLIINFKSVNIGNVVETVKLNSFTGEVNKVLLNAKLLLPMLRVFSDQEIEINWIYAKNQYRLLFKEIGNNNFKQLLLLLRN